MAQPNRNLFSIPVRKLLRGATSPPRRSCAPRSSSSSPTSTRPWRSLSGGPWCKTFMDSLFSNGYSQLQLVKARGKLTRGTEISRRTGRSRRLSGRAQTAKIMGGRRPNPHDKSEQIGHRSLLRRAMRAATSGLAGRVSSGPTKDRGMSTQVVLITGGLTCIGRAAAVSFDEVGSLQCSAHADKIKT
jgi:hypothetical protein